MMRIVEYDDVDPLQVLQLNQLCLDFALTPELVSLIRRMDPRPFPCFALYALAGDAVVGQVGVFRLPVVSAAGAGEVGGVWAVSTHPEYQRQGIATQLLAAAHERMRDAGLRFSTLGTDRYLVAHALYGKEGYSDLYSPAMVTGRSELLHDRAEVCAEPAGVSRLDLADRLFERIAAGKLGFARRHTPFFSVLHARRDLDAQNLWLLWRGNELIGYAAAMAKGSVLRVTNLLLTDGAAATVSVAALARAANTQYIFARLDQVDHIAAFREAGFRVANQGWATFMVKPLAPDATVTEFRQLYGPKEGRFLISCMDVT